MYVVVIGFYSNSGKQYVASVLERNLNEESVNFLVVTGLGERRWLELKQYLECQHAVGS